MLWELIRLSLLLFLLRNVHSRQDDLPEVLTPLGKLRGFWKTTINGRKYAAFEGIPYAKPPVGDLRFEAPQPITDPWLGIKDVANNTRQCLQPVILPTGVTDTIVGEEDCLYLNVYVPAEFLHKPGSLDVVVWIHGGAFTYGSGRGTSNESIILDRDIIFVSFNFRLNILGFLSTEDDVIPGNDGMKDQVLALEWVNDNIFFFGGNFDSITIAGQSSGGASVHLHYLSALSRGLFVSGISQSGTALAPWAVRKNPLQKAKKLAVLVDCPYNTSTALKACLKQKPAVTLVQQVKNFFAYGNILPFCPFGPVVEKLSKRPFLTKEPLELLKEGHVHDVPWIASITADDGLVPSIIYYNSLDQIDQQWPQISKDVLDYKGTIATSQEETVANQIREFYLGKGEQINQKNFLKFTKMLTDSIYGLGSEVAAKIQASVNESPVYFYLFNYSEGERSILRGFPIPVKGTCHGDDTIYFFGALFQSGNFSGNDELLKDACQDALYSFASTGTPSFDGIDAWQPTLSEELVYLNITGPDNLTLETVEELTPINFWTNLGILKT